jgi:hypothetical protein
MSIQSILTNPASLRTALFGLAAVLIVVALVIRKIREKRSPEPRVIRLTLASDMPPIQAAEGASQSAPAGQSPPPQPAERPLHDEAARISSAAATLEMSPLLAEARPSRAPEVLESGLPPQALGAAPEVPGAEIASPVLTLERPQTPEAPDLSQPAEAFPPSVEEPAPATAQPAGSYSLLALQERSPVILDILRGALIMIAIVVAAALLLVVMPQSGVDRMAAALRPRNAPGPPPEKIAFLYLGDEVKENQFHIRGVIKNITDKPIEQLDATIRLYAPDRTLLETALVRMDSDIIFPDSTASFHLSYPDYHGQFGSYSLDFKLRQGDPVLYKDMRDASRATS